MGIEIRVVWGLAASEGVDVDENDWTEEAAIEWARDLAFGLVDRGEEDVHILRITTEEIER